MRILSRKIWRAFPELDQFDDNVCARLIRRITTQDNMWKTIAILSVSVMIAFVAWSLGVRWIKAFYFGMPNSGASAFSSDMSFAFILLSFSGHIWFPIISFYLARDRWFHHCIRKFVVGISCGDCGYSLIGLSLVMYEGEQSVRCPECGQFTKLGERGFIEADINPALLTKG